MARKKKSDGWEDEHADQTVELPADAPTTLRSGGLTVSPKGSGLRLVTGSGRIRKEFIILMPHGDGGWVASVPRPLSSWLVTDARRWNKRLHLALALGERHPVSVRAHIVAEPLKTLARQIKLDLRSEPPPKKKRRKKKPGPPPPGIYERSLSRRGPLQAGSPGLKQQRH